MVGDNAHSAASWTWPLVPAAANEPPALPLDVPRVDEEKSYHGLEGIRAGLGMLPFPCSRAQLNKLHKVDIV